MLLIAGCGLITPGGGLGGYVINSANFIYWGADYVDPNTNASAFAYKPDDGTKTPAWRVGWQIPALSQLTLDAAAENDKTRRNALYTRLQHEVQDSSPYVVTLQGQTPVGIPDTVQHADQDIADSMLYYDQVSKSSE